MASWDILREARASVLGRPLGFVQFFQPTSGWIEWVKARYPSGTQLYDAGCGAGQVTKALREAAPLRVTALDLFRHTEPVIDDVLYRDSTVFPYDKGSVVLLCRPCHDGFCVETIAHALSLGVHDVLYVSRLENVMMDLRGLRRKFRIVYRDSGEDGEVTLSTRKSG